MTGEKGLEAAVSSTQKRALPSAYQLIRHQYTAFTPQNLLGSTFQRLNSHWVLLQQGGSWMEFAYDFMSPLVLFLVALSSCALKYNWVEEIWSLCSSSPKLQVRAKSKLNFWKGKEVSSTIQKGIGRKRSICRVRSSQRWSSRPGQWWQPGNTEPAWVGAQNPCPQLQPKLSLIISQTLLGKKGLGHTVICPGSREAVEGYDHLQCFFCLFGGSVPWEGCVDLEF